MEHGAGRILDDRHPAVVHHIERRNDHRSAKSRGLPCRGIGVKITNEPGALCWSELTTRDAKAAAAFYTEMFGWAGKHSNVGTPTEYHEFSVGDQPSIGMMPMPQEMPPSVPSYWMPYFQVADLDAAVSTATSNGGQLMIGPAPIPGTGRFAILTDPQGAMFAVFQRD
jgi:predicted enzyme related to lactoylglutathione lyase